MKPTTLAIFFRKCTTQEKINPTHISIYMLLFHYWNSNDNRNPINISRADVMQKAKIHSNATYHKCIKDLQGLGFIKYEPSYHPQQGSRVYLLNLNDENGKMVL
jgi:hypothetical protein